MSSIPSDIAGAAKPSPGGVGDISIDKLVATIPKNVTEEIRIVLSEFRGHHLCNVRVFAAYNAQTERRPTKKGITVKVEALSALIEGLHAALAEAKASGLLREQDRAS